MSGIIIDSSALMAIVNDEPEATRLAEKMAASTCRISLGTWVEVGIVADSRSATYGAHLDEIIEGFGIERVPVTGHQADVARAAYRRFGFRPTGVTTPGPTGPELGFSIELSSDASCRPEPPTRRTPPP